MAITIDIPPTMVRQTHAYAGRRGVSVEQLICDYIATIPREPIRRPRIRIGSMRDELSLPPTFDADFDALDKEIAVEMVGECRGVVSLVA